MVGYSFLFFSEFSAIAPAVIKSTFLKKSNFNYVLENAFKKSNIVNRRENYLWEVHKQG